MLRVVMSQAVEQVPQQQQRAVTQEEMAALEVLAQARIEMQPAIHKNAEGFELAPHQNT